MAMLKAIFFQKWDFLILIPVFPFDFSDLNLKYSNIPLSPFLILTSGSHWKGWKEPEDACLPLLQVTAVIIYIQGEIWRGFFSLDAQPAILDIFTPCPVKTGTAVLIHPPKCSWIVFISY